MKKNLAKISGTLHEHLRTFYCCRRQIDMKVLTSSEMVPGCKVHRGLKLPEHITVCTLYVHTLRNLLSLPQRPAGSAAPHSPLPNG